MVQRTKPVELLVNKAGGRGRKLQVVDTGDRSVPPLPALAQHVGDEARAAWADLWQSVVRGAIDLQADADILAEYVLIIDERERLRKAMREGTMTPPMVTRMNAIERHMLRIREHLGLTPLARFRLQLSVVTSREALERLEERAAARQTRSESRADDAAVAGATVIEMTAEAVPEPWRPGVTHDGSDSDAT